MQDNILVIGSSGQIGSELVIELRKEYGDNNVIASDIVPSSEEIINSGPFELLNVTDSEKLLNIINKHKINQVYLLAAILSAKAEKNQKHALRAPQELRKPLQTASGGHPDARSSPGASPEPYLLLFITL